jgi:hypothetical protein
VARLKFRDISAAKMIALDEDRTPKIKSGTLMDSFDGYNVHTCKIVQSSDADGEKGTDWIVAFIAHVLHRPRLDLRSR